MIQVEKAGHWFKPGRWLFRDLSLSLQPGTITAVLGPNGTGKTTLLRAITGTLGLKEGEVSGQQQVGFVPQALHADQAYRAIDMVLLGRSRYLGRFNAPGKIDVQRAAECLADVGLSAIAEQRYDHLSGGQRQLVLLARALATDCQTLVLDEPVSALDLANQGVVLRLLDRLAHERNLAILFTTHHPDHALAIADTALLMLETGQSFFGQAGDTLTEANLTDMYGVKVRRVLVTSEGEQIQTIVPLYGLSRP